MFTDVNLVCVDIYTLRECRVSSQGIMKNMAVYLIAFDYSQHK